MKFSLNVAFIEFLFFIPVRNWHEFQIELCGENIFCQEPQFSSSSTKYGTRLLRIECVMSYKMYVNDDLFVFTKFCFYTDKKIKDVLQLWNTI